MKRVICCVAALALVCQGAGCCRMCCWQHGGSWYNGQCYAPQQLAAPAAAPYAVPPQTVAPYTVVPQSTTAPAVLPQTTAPSLVPRQTFVPVNPCGCPCN
ncbi:MAG TPA: hypothetical protein VIK18_18660 [Pirellulales bacterium]